MDTTMPETAESGPETRPRQPAKAQAVVHGSADAVTEQDSTTFEAIEGMAVFDGETLAF